MKSKNNYKIDNSNRLVVKRNRKTLLTNGKFNVDKDNRLIYWLNEPADWHRQYGLPGRISFIGNWRLNPNYDLELILNKTDRQYEGDILALKGEIISTDRDSLIFEIKSYDKGGQSHIQIIKLSGCWQADEFNRIIFAVAKKKSPDILALQGAWQLNKSQQIIYTYEKTRLKRKRKICHTLAFEGFWQINNKNKLTYILSRSNASRFDFRIQIESPNLYPQQGVIKYRLGIGIKDSRFYRDRIICLYGVWKFSKKLGLIFEMEYAKGKVYTIEFGTDISLNKRDKVVFSLINKRQEPLGLKIAFSHRFLKQADAEAFVRLKKICGKETAVESGITIPF